jgi:predicted PurR-regulated permease PerM
MNTSTLNEQPPTPRVTLASNRLWQRRFFVVLTILGWLALTIAVIWGIGQIITPIVLIGFAALIAYLIFPLVRFFERHMPRVLAILASIVILLAVIGFVIYFVVLAAVQQFGLLIGGAKDIIEHPEKYPQVQAGLSKLGALGLSKGQIHVSGEQVVSYLEKAIGGVVPILGSIFLLMISLLLVATLAVYFMVDGARIASWLRHETPLRYRSGINVFLDEMDHSLGGFVRGQVLMATIMAVIVGIGAFIIGVPYVFLLALVVFVCEFIPQVGSYISGAIGVLFALTHGWQVALIYLAYVTVMQAGLDGQILSPRILGHAVGLHPIISVFALLVGTALFGLLGALFACPAAGIIQTFVRAFWNAWRERHPDQFPAPHEQERQPAGVEAQSGPGHDQPAVSA